MNLKLLLPDESLFTHNPRGIHGVGHVRRVMMHARNLVVALNDPLAWPSLRAAVYLHDIARTHDGRCEKHGADAIAKLMKLPHEQQWLAKHGVNPERWPAIFTAVTWHCLPFELPREHPHRQLTAMLKDADALDRVRLGGDRKEGLNFRFLRFPESLDMVGFAHELFAQDQQR